MSYLVGTGIMPQIPYSICAGTMGTVQIARAWLANVDSERAFKESCNENCSNKLLHMDMQFWTSEYW